MTTDALPDAGPELNKLVAKALGWITPDKKSVFLLDWSTSDMQAWDALEVWREQHPDRTGRISLPRRNWNAGKEYRVQLWRQGRFDDSVVMGCAPTLAEAICQAIVLAGREVGE